MTKIIVLSDSGVGKTSWLYAMNGHVPLNVYRSTATEQFEFTKTTPSVLFVGVHARVSDSTLQKHCAGADGMVVLYNNTSNPMLWLFRMRRLYRHHNLPTIVCCHGATPCTSYASMLEASACHHCFTSLEEPTSILDCVNRIITLARQTLASPLSDVETTQDD